MRARLKSIVGSGDRIRFTPPASAIAHSPVRRLWHARCTATSDDEHAVSIVMRGTLQAEEIRQAAGGDARRIAGAEVGIDARRIADLASCRWA